MNRVRIEQAFYGYSGGHKLLSTSLPKEKIETEMVSFADLPYSLPSGVKSLESYISGRPFKEYYVFQRTIIVDNSARRGTTFSHALLIKLEDVNLVYDLNVVFNHFANKPIYEEEPLSIDLELEDGISSNKNTSRLFPNVVHYLLKSSEPIVWQGLKNLNEFEQIIEQLWIRLDSNFRKTFSFHLSLTKEDLTYFPFSIVFIPEEIKNQYQGLDIIKMEDETVLASSHSERLLLSKGKKGDFNKFISDLGFHPKKINDLNRVEKCYCLYQKLLSLNTGDLRVLAGLIALFSPDPNNAILTKDNVFKQLESKTLSSSTPNITDISGLFNFKTSSFTNGNDRLQKIICKWILERLSSSNKKKLNQFNEHILLKYSISSNASIWDKSIHKGLKDLFKNWTKELAKIVWSIWGLNEKTIKILSGYLPSNAEKLLLETIPTPIENIDSILKFSKRKKWLTLHGKLIIKTEQAQKAFKEQLKIDKDKNNLGGLNEICKKVKPNEIIEAALLSGDERLLDFAAKECVKKPSLLKDINVVEINWRRIWAKRNNEIDDIWEGISNPEKVTNKTLNLLIQDQSIEEELLIEIASSIQGNIWSFPKRNQIWKKLPITSRDIFLEKTINHFLKNVIEKDGYNNIEKEIESWIITNFRKVYSNYSWSVLLSLFESIQSLDDEDLKVVVKYNERISINSVVANRIGKLVNKKDWEETASQLLKIVKKNSSYYDSVDKCFAQLSIIGKMKFLAISKSNQSSISKDEWYRKFESVSFKLYKKGVTDKNIWERAGGEISEININSPGKQQWRNALSLLRNGAGIKITTKKLLKTMKEEDFQSNEELLLLYNHYINNF